MCPSNILGVTNNNVFIPLTAATKRTKELTLSLSSGSNFTLDSTERAVAIFYQDSAGAWRMVFNISMTGDMASSSNWRVTINGVTFKTIASHIGQLVSFAIYDASKPIDIALALSGTSSIEWFHSGTTSVTNGQMFISGDVALNAEPTWASLGTTAAAALEGVLPVDVYIPEVTASNAGILGTGANTIAGVKTFASGIKLPTTGGTAATLDYYEEGSFTLYMHDGVPNVTAGQTAYYVRTGKQVTLYIPEFSITSVSTVRYLSSSSSAGTKALPVVLKPARNQVVTCFTYESSTYTSSVAIVSSSGNGHIDIFSGVAAFSSNNVAKGNTIITITYSLT
jgi:hypothetical protein